MKIRITALILSLIMVFGLAACGSNPAATQTGKSSSELTTKTKENNSAVEPIALRLEGGNTGTPNPFRHTTRGPGIFKMQLLYDGLLEKGKTGDIPALAKSWDKSDDGTTYTFHLEENVLWHDGIPMTADDVAFTFEYYRSHTPVYNTLTSGGKYIVKSTEVIDKHTVKITLTTFNNAILSNLGAARIIPKHIWENIDDPTAYDGKDSTIGCGPFMMDTFNAEQGSYRIVAFKDYWRHNQTVKAIEWVPVSDNMLAFENGEIDLLNASADILSRYESNNEYEVKKVSALHSFRLMMNMESVETLQNINVRKAIAYALNEQEMIKNVARGSATLSSMGYIPMDSPWYNPKTTQYSYDSDKAKELLNGKTYSFKLLTDNSSNSTKTAEMVKIYLKAVGINVTIESVESKVRDAAIASGKYELVLNYIGGMGGDPDYLCSVYGENAGVIRGWTNNRVFELLKAQTVEQDAEARKDMINEIQDLISKDVPMIMMYGMVMNYVYRPAKYDGWSVRYDHNMLDHVKLSYMDKEQEQ